MKKYKTTIIITTLITLLPIVIGLFLWNKLPDTLATHWGSDGTANGWSSKTFSVFGMPLMGVVDNASDENNENTRRKATVVPIKIEYV